MTIQIPKLRFFEDPEEQKKEEIDFEEEEFLFEEEEFDFEEEEFFFFEEEFDEEEFDFDEEEFDFDEEEFDFEEEEEEFDFDEEETTKKKKKWIKLHRALFEAGIVFLSEKLKRKRGQIILSLITYLTILHPIGELHLFLNNCASGCLRTALAIHDAIQRLPRPGHTVGYGMTASVGSLILVSGHKRLAQPHARILIQEPKFKFPIKIKTNNRILIGKRKIKNLRRYTHEDKKKFGILTEYFREIFVGKTGQSYDIIQKDLKENVVMSAKEAQDYGIIDGITTDFKMKSLLHKALLPNRDDTPGWR